MYPEYPPPLNSVCRMMPGVLFFNRYTTYENPTVTGNSPMTSHHLNAWLSVPFAS